jgi:hypothetical protein
MHNNTVYVKAWLHATHDSKMSQAWPGQTNPVHVESLVKLWPMAYNALFGHQLIK